MQQKVYLPGWPWVDRSISPGKAPPRFLSMSRIARPTVAFAGLPSPRQLIPMLKRPSCATAPLTITQIPTGFVVGCRADKLNWGSAIASVAAMMIGKSLGLQPAMTALTAINSIVASPYPGGRFVITLSLMGNKCPSIFSMRAWVGGMIGKPSPQ